MNRIVLFQDLISQAQAWFLCCATPRPALEDAGKPHHAKTAHVLHGATREPAPENVGGCGNKKIWAGTVRHGDT